jgi:diadenylate cyclase
MIAWLWQTLEWNDVLDIGIMSFLLYRALLILRGTRAFQSMIGLLGVLVLYVLAEQLGLASIHWLLEKFSVYIVLAVIILFQQDIRRGLARAGGRLVPGFRTQGDAVLREELVRACFTLASRRVGALIAIEREGSLDELVEGGTQLDALPSHDLVLSIFHPTSPLHDGAIVIQKGRLIAAQVFFPLSLSKDISRFFGTRHRAAIGLTEEADAIVIIVSEERGTVSIVQGGKITPTQDANELRAKLQEIFQSRAAEPEPEPAEAG